jgi:hypothetical protein
MSIQGFLKKENIDTLWDVIIDEDIFKFLSRDIQGKVFQVFLDNIKGFFEVEKTNTTELIDMNKKYILLILSHIRKNYPEKMPNKIKIFDEPLVKESITYEEIQNEKKTQFEKDFMKRQEEFTNAMALPVPEVPDFTDKFTDSPISGMEKIIKEITAKRNYDIEQINRKNQEKIENADNWLKPQETSIKSEKLITKTNQHEEPNNQNRLKYLNNQDKNLDNNTIIEKNKNVSWGLNEEFYLHTSLEKIEEDEEYENNIFKKLKKVPSNLENITLTMNDDSPNVEERLTHIEKTLEKYNNKMDKILELLQNRENK